jgi:glutathione synthase
MKIGFFVNSIAEELEEYTTTHLAYAALKMGHEPWYISVDDFAYDPDERVRARARTVAKSSYRSPTTFFADLQDSDAPVERITVDDLDVLLLRNDPAVDAVDRPWAQSVGIIFGEIAARRGVLVLNDPTGLSRSLHKLYFQQFPPQVRPKTLITRDRDELVRFVKDQDGNAVLKPLQGSGGQGVFLVESDEAANLNQIIDAIGRDGYVVAQEYLTEASEGDLRLFLMNGLPLEHDGVHAAMRRVNEGDDPRSNMHAGAKAQQAEVDDDVLRIAELARPKLIQDGLFLVGLDIVGDKLMEVNVFSAGGLHSVSELTGVDFPPLVIDALERKLDSRNAYPGCFTNVELATM